MAAWCEVSRPRQTSATGLGTGEGGSTGLAAPWGGGGGLARLGWVRGGARAGTWWRGVAGGGWLVSNTDTAAAVFLYPDLVTALAGTIANINTSNTLAQGPTVKIFDIGSSQIKYQI